MGRVVRRVVEILFLSGAAALASGVAFGAEAPPTAEVLVKIHRTNVKEISMGQMAQLEGRSKDVKAFGKTLVKDHSSADKKVAKLAKEEKITLTEVAPSSDAETLPTGEAFDASFAKMMLAAHRRDIAELEAVRDSTSDEKLKRLLNELLPVLHQHEETARRLTDQTNRS